MTKKTAYKIHQMGANITAIAGDGKAPMYKWKADVDKRQDTDRLRRLPWGGYTRKDGAIVPPAGRVGIIHSTTVGQWRCFDVDALKDGDGRKVPVGVEPLLTLMSEMRLPPDYPWAMRSGSGAGWHIYIRCESSLPPGVLTEKAGEKGVFTGKPLNPGEFDHIELRWHGVQSVPNFASADDVPHEPPALVGSEAVVRAFLAVAPAAPAAPPLAPHDDTVDQVKARLDLVDVAGRLFGAGVQEGDEVRFPNNGGLLVHGGKQQWYCHQSEQGGDVLDMLCYHKYGSVLNGDKERFREMLKEAALLAGVELGARASDRARTGGGRGATDPSHDAGDGGVDALSPLPQIDIASGELGEIVAELWQHVLASPYATRLYRYGDTLVLHGDEGIQTLDNVRWRGIVSRCAIRYDSAPKRPRALLWRTNDPEIADSLLNIPDDVPGIERIVSMPVFSAAGKLLTNGYHASERVLVQSPINPKEMSVDAAKTLLWDLFQDFPFATDADYANTIGYLFLPFIRSMCGATPLHLIDAAQRGTGKGLLNDIIHSIWGVENEVGGLPLMEEEQRKAITSRLASAPLSIAFDDVNLLQGHALQRAITARVWVDRLLGSNKNITVPVQCVWSATGNNTTLGGDMVRRVVLIRLESQHERPEDRTDTHRSESELRLWAIQNRAAFVSACCSLIQHGLTTDAGAGVAFGGFDEYSSVLDRILSGVGIEGFLGNRVSAYEREDTRQTGWKVVVQEWHERWGNEPKKPKDILALIDQMEDTSGLYIDGDTERSRTTKVGNELKKRIGTVYAYPEYRLRIVRSKTNDGKSKPAFAVEELPNSASESNSPTSPTLPTLPRLDFTRAYEESSHTRARAHEKSWDATLGRLGKVGESDCNAECCHSRRQATPHTPITDGVGGVGGIPHQEAQNAPPGYAAARQIVAGQHGWSIHQVGEHFEARQLLHRPEPNPQHAGTIEECLDYANERGAGIQVCTVEERGGYALQYRPAPRGTWRVVDSEGRNVTGYEYANEEQARDVLDARAGRRND
jgi:hypothetical protein